MFTGIIEYIGTVKMTEFHEERLRLWVQTPFEALDLGESVAVDGVCLTVAEFQPEDRTALFFVSGETLQKTNFQEFQETRPVHLERAMAAGGRFSGHWVQGHVDGTARVFEVRPEGESYTLICELDQKWIQYCVDKGSICLSGVSLTINQVTGCQISINVIPHTWENTHIHRWRVGDKVNFEADILSKYVLKHLENLCPPSKRP